MKGLWETLGASANRFRQHWHEIYLQKKLNIYNQKDRHQILLIKRPNIQNLWTNLLLTTYNVPNAETLMNAIKTIIRIWDPKERIEFNKSTFITLTLFRIQGNVDNLMELECKENIKFRIWIIFHANILTSFHGRYQKLCANLLNIILFKSKNSIVWRFKKFKNIFLVTSLIRNDIKVSFSKKGFHKRRKCPIFTKKIQTHTTDNHINRSTRSRYHSETNRRKKKERMFGKY